MIPVDPNQEAVWRAGQPAIEVVLGVHLLPVIGYRIPVHRDGIGLGRQIEAEDLERARSRPGSVEISLTLERLEVLGDGLGRADAESGTDFAYAGLIGLSLEVIDDEVLDATLDGGEHLGHSRLLTGAGG